MKLLFMVSALILPLSVFSMGSDVAARVGVDAQWRFMPLQKDAGDNVVKKHYPQGSIYGGVNLNEFLGFELGYQSTTSAHRQSSFTENYIYFSSPQTGITDYSRDINTTQASIKGFYGNLVGFLPISEEYRLKLIASIGVARLKATIESQADTYDSTGEYLFSTNLKFSRRAWIPRLSVGLQHMITENIGIRSMFGWEKISKFSRIVGIDTAGDGVPDTFFAKLKNSTTLGLGVFYSF